MFRVPQEYSLLIILIEYLLFEILDLTIHVTKQNKRVVIAPDDIKKAIKNDDELKRTLCRLKICA